MKYTLSFIRTNPEYIRLLRRMVCPLETRVKDLVYKVHQSCPELTRYCQHHPLNSLYDQDKGKIGKQIEFYLFGNHPNISTSPDTLYGDIKTTHFKRLRHGGWNAKERLTLGNVGQTNFSEYANLEEIPMYSKIRKGIVFILVKEFGCSSFWEERIIDIVMYDMETFPVEQQTLISSDFNSIRLCFETHKVSQKGQQYLHIHKHGGKGSTTRALGFTNKCVTWMVSHSLGLALQQQGWSTYIQF